MKAAKIGKWRWMIVARFQSKTDQRTGRYMVAFILSIAAGRLCSLHLNIVLIELLTFSDYACATEHNAQSKSNLRKLDFY